MELIRECTVADARQVLDPPGVVDKEVGSLEIAGLGCERAMSAGQAVAGVNAVLRN